MVHWEAEGEISKGEEGRISGSNTHPVGAGGNAQKAIRQGRLYFGSEIFEPERVQSLEMSRKTFQKCKTR